MTMRKSGEPGCGAASRLPGPFREHEAPNRQRSRRPARRAAQLAFTAGAPPLRARSAGPGDRAFSPPRARLARGGGFWGGGGGPTSPPPPEPRLFAREARVLGIEPSRLREHGSRAGDVPEAPQAPDGHEVGEGARHGANHRVDPPGGLTHISPRRRDDRESGQRLDTLREDLQLLPVLRFREIELVLAPEDLGPCDVEALRRARGAGDLRGLVDLLESFGELSFEHRDSG